MSRPRIGFTSPASRLSRARGGAVSASASSAGVDLATVLGPVRSQNTFEETVERLLAVIKLGVVGRGDRFPPERELAALLGVSRITLREAIGDLRNAGYVESRRGRFGGTFVTYTPPAPSDVELRRIAVEDADKINDALTFRMAVETGSAQILAQLGERDRDGRGRSGERIRDVLLTRLGAVNQACPEDYRRMDTLFHLAIAELTGSSLLASACADARVRLNDLLNAIPVLQRNIEHTAAQHTAIVEGILAGDTRRAQRAVAEHLDGTAALLRGFLEGPSAGVNPQPWCGG
jgi:DNA-binding FadR family transcriptional regulator